jgi:hypothetical protein
MLKACIRYLSIFLVVIFALVILEYARQGFIQDISMQPVNLETTPDLGSEAPVNRPAVYLLSYADGKEHVFRNQNALGHYALNKNIDFILNYRKSHIDHDFYYKNLEIFKENVGAGLWLWKPYFVDKALNSAPENAIIVYLDSAFMIKKPLNGLIRELEQNDIILIHDHGRKNGAFIKGDSFALMDCTTEQCRQSPHIGGGVLLVKNTPYARKFVKNWLTSAQDIRIISNQDYKIKENYPEFLWHNYDQSVLSLIYAKNPSKVKLIAFDDLKPFMSWFHRKPSKSSPAKGCYTVYGTDPLVNFSNNGKSLPSTALLNLRPVVYIRKFIIEWFGNDKICQ